MSSDPSSSALATVDALLGQVRTFETLEDVFAAWGALRAEHRQAQLRWKERRAQLSRQGQFLLGTVQAASAPSQGPTEEALTAPQVLDRYLREAQAQLEVLEKAAQAQEEREEAVFGQAFLETRALLHARVQRHLLHRPPHLTLRLRNVGAGQVILQGDRLSPDASVLLLVLLTGALPSRYGFLFDDATEDLSREPPWLYGEEGVAASHTRPEAPVLRALVQAAPQVLPVKGCVPVLVPLPSGGTRLYRLLQRGAVMELETEEEGGYRHLLSRAEAESFAGHLLRLKLAGKMGLDVLPD